MKNCAANAAHCQGSVGRRIARRSTSTALSARNDGQQSFQQPIPGSWFLPKNNRRGLLRNLRVQNSYSRSSAVKKQEAFGDEVAAAPS